MAVVEDGEPAPSATIYVRNLNEKIKIPELTKELRDTFQDAGTIIDVVAKKNIKAKGQAFIVFESVEEATEALDLFQDYEMFGQEMKLQFAKSRSDATVKQEDGDEELETHKRHRLAEKERKQAQAAALEAAQAAKRPAADNLAERPAKTAKPVAAAAGGAVSDEYLPPNKILFLRELPESYGKTELASIFQRYPGFKEVRMIPSRKGIAFVEYESEEGAIAAKEATMGMVLDEKAIRVTFQKK